jgi:galactitol-specific phosphotransferase system IIB component
MNNRQIRFRVIVQITLILLGSLTLLCGTSCASKETRAQKAVEEFLKNQGLRDLKVDMVHTSKEYPDKAYISVTVTYNYATSDGTFQREMLGYILNKNGQDYSVEKPTSYTKDEQKAETLIAGKK